MTETTLEEANASLRGAVSERMATTPPDDPKLVGYRPPESDAYSEWTPPDYARREEAIAGFRRVVEQARPVREARGVHPSSQAFYDLCDQLKQIHHTKSIGYGSPDDPLANIRNGATFVGIEPWRAAMVRLSDKVTRLQTYCRTGTLTCESFEDNCIDLASYALLTLLMHRETKRD